MVTQKASNRVSAGHLLVAQNGVQVYELSTTIPYWSASDSFEQKTVAFSEKNVVLRVSSGPEYGNGSASVLSQVTLSIADFKKLIASYRAFERSQEKNTFSSSSSPNNGYDPFLDDDEIDETEYQASGL